ncbi:MAG: hypothetical protein V2A73_03540 [Pseudomonadota bacterium]
MRKQCILSAAALVTLFASRSAVAETTDEVAAASARKPIAAGMKLGYMKPSSVVDGTLSILLEFRWRLPWHERRLAAAVEVGWNRLVGSGEQVDQQLGSYRFEWSSHSVPIHLGLEYALPIGGLPIWLQPFVAAGFAMGPVMSSADYRNADGHSFITKNPGDGFALGFFAGVGATLPLGPGQALAEYRYESLRTDMQYPWVNPAAGEFQGHTLHFGYRLEL